MTSWHDLPFEVKSQILSNYISIMLSYTQANACLLSMSSLGGFIRAIFSFLHNAPEMLDEAIGIVTSMIKKCELLDETLMQDLETLWASGRYDSTMPVHEEEKPLLVNLRGWIVV